MKHIIKIIIIACVVLGVSAGLWFYLNGYLTKSKASSSAAHFSFSQTSMQVKAGDAIKVNLMATAPSGVSGVDVVFKTVGTTLDFVAEKTIAELPTGFELIVPKEQPTLATDSINAGVSLYRPLRRLVYVSRKSAATLPKSIIIPLYFKIVNNGQSSSESIITLDLVQSQVVGVSTVDTATQPVSGYVYTLEGEQNPLTFTAIVKDSRAASVKNLSCSSSCGRNVMLKWGDSENETGYTLFKDGKALTGLAQNSTSYLYSWCGDFKLHTFAVIATNQFGSVSTNSPSVDCGCALCPTKAPPTPTPITPTNSSDLIFRLNFPDAAQSVTTIPQVNVMVVGNSGEKVCADDTNCLQVITLTRMGSTTYFSSPQLQFNLKTTKPYSLIVKQPHTVQRTYKNIFLKWQKVLNCLGNSSESGCGQLISNEINTRPMYSGDVDGLDKTAAGFNIIDITDLTRVGDIADAQKTTQTKSAEGDMNFDGSTDVKDYGVVAKNLNKKGD